MSEIISLCSDVEFWIAEPKSQNFYLPKPFIVKIFDELIPLLKERNKEHIFRIVNNILECKIKI
jgi:hypothetical protein